MICLLSDQGVALTLRRCHTLSGGDSTGELSGNIFTVTPVSAIGLFKRTLPTHSFPMFWTIPRTFPNTSEREFLLLQSALYAHKTTSQSYGVSYNEGLLRDRRHGRKRSIRRRCRRGSAVGQRRTCAREIPCGILPLSSTYTILDSRSELPATVPEVAGRRREVEELSVRICAKFNGMWSGS